MEAHSPTMFLVIIAVNATLTVSLAAVASRGNRDGLYLWALGLALHTVAFTFFGLRGEISDFTSIIVAAAILSASWAMFTEGLFQFQRRPPPRRLLWLPVAVISITFFLFLDNHPVRVVVGSVIYAAQIAFILIVLYQGRRATVGRGQYFVAIALAPAIPILVFRGFLAITGQADRVSILASNQVQAVSFLASIIVTILVTLGLVMMNKERAEDLSRRCAIQDQLTGLANRRRIDEVLSMEWARATRNGSPLSLVMLDVDLFKKFNDRYGHQMGDECLKRVASVLQVSAQRGGDLAARYGGEEFLLILPDTDTTSAQRLTEAVRLAISSLGLPHDHSPFGQVTISAGIATMTRGSYKNAECLLRAADMVLYQAKQGGRNQVQTAPEPAMQTDTSGQDLRGFVHLVWHSAYECGNPVIDGQHRGLFDRANNLLTAALAEKPADDIFAHIDALLRDIAQHFHEEEAIIAAAGFTDTAEHIASHRDLIAQGNELVKCFHEGTLGIGELFKFLAHDVVARHFLGEDRKFFPFVADSRLPIAA